MPRPAEEKIDISMPTTKTPRTTITSVPRTGTFRIAGSPFLRKASIARAGREYHRVSSDSRGGTTRSRRVLVVSARTRRVQ
jgi:hypothetical protein